MSKTKNIVQLTRIVKVLKRQRKKIVFTNGCFDILHLGHIRYLKKAKKLGDVLIVGLNSDKSVKKLKGKKRPITKDVARAEIIASLDFVDYVIIFDEISPKNLILKLKPDLQVKGGDYKEEDVLEKDAVESYGGKVVVVKEEKGFSTSNLIKKILKVYAKRKCM